VWRGCTSRRGLCVALSAYRAGCREERTGEKRKQGLRLVPPSSSSLAFSPTSPLLPHQSSNRHLIRHPQYFTSAALELPPQAERSFVHKSSLCLFPLFLSSHRDGWLPAPYEGRLSRLLDSPERHSIPSALPDGAHFSQGSSSSNFNSLRQRDATTGQPPAQNVGVDDVR
jgi:hypothetical protein